MENKFQEWIDSYTKEEPFCPFLPAYCDTPNYAGCKSCELLIKLHGGNLDDCISED